MMNEKEQILEQMDYLCNGDAWHGPSLREALEGVSAAQAGKRPIAGAHSIWELLLHLEAWTAVTQMRLEGTTANEPPAGDFPAVPLHLSPSQLEERWSADQARFNATIQQLRDAIAAVPMSRLQEICPGRTYPISKLLFGGVHHVAYHVGQMMLLRKALA